MSAELRETDPLCVGWYLCRIPGILGVGKGQEGPNSLLPAPTRHHTSGPVPCGQLRSWTMVSGVWISLRQDPRPSVLRTVTTG